MNVFDKNCRFWLYFIRLEYPRIYAWIILCLFSTGTTNYNSGTMTVTLDRRLYENFMGWQLLKYIANIMRRVDAPLADVEGY